MTHGLELAIDVASLQSRGHMSPHTSLSSHPFVLPRSLVDCFADTQNGWIVGENPFVNAIVIWSDVDRHLVVCTLTQDLL
ncbi:hypothetical protein M3J09_008294 [Ascochyta lentis]